MKGYYPKNKGPDGKEQKCNDDMAAGILEKFIRIAT